MPENQKQKEQDKAIFLSGIILFLLASIFLALGIIGMLLSGDASLFSGGPIQYVAKHAFSLLIIGIILCGTSIYMILSKRPQN